MIEPLSSQQTSHEYKVGDVVSYSNGETGTVNKVAESSYEGNIITVFTVKLAEDKWRSFWKVNALQ